MLKPKNAIDLVSPWSSFLFYGAGGSGKTSVAATFPRPLFLIPVNEQSIVTLRGLDFPYYEVLDMSSQFKEATGQGGMRALIDMIVAEYNRDPKNFPYDTIVVDALSHYCELVADEISKGGTMVMDQRHWGQMGGHLRDIQVKLSKCQVHTVFTTLAETKEIGENKFRGRPMLYGKTAEILPTSCGTIGYMETTKVSNVDTYRVNFRKTGIYDARTRYAFPPKIDCVAGGAPFFEQIEPYLNQAAISPLG
jgi:AAA domain